MKRSVTISAIAHIAALVLCVLSLASQPQELSMPPTLAVGTISDKDFTQITQGVKNAPKLKIDMPKPLADIVGAPKTIDQLAPKAANKPEIKTESAKAAPQPKPETKPDPKPAQKADKPLPPEYKPDQIADLLKKDAAKKPAKPDDQSTPQKADAPKFDADEVAQLLDKRDPRRQVASNATVNDAANLGAASGAPAAQLSLNETDAFRKRVSDCWSPPPGVDANSSIYVDLRIFLKQDGTLAQQPVVVAGSPSSLGPALADSAKRALLLCQPFTMFKPEHYDQWKDLQLRFDPHEMLGG